MPLPRAVVLRFLALACLVLLFVRGMTAGASSSRAATPPPAASIGPSPEYFPIEVWLDRPLPTDAAPGTEVHLGATFWDPQVGQLGPGNAYYLRILPAAGSGPASEAVPVRDQPWHVTGTLVVPEGGLGELQVGQVGSACTESGCTRSDVLYRIAGVGPPPDAPLIALADAVLEPLLASPEAGTPVETTVELEPKVDWAQGAFPAPDRLFLRARVPRGPVLVEVPLVRDPADGPVRYTGTLTLPEAGPYVLDVATVPGADAGDVFASSTTAVTAVPPDAAASPDASGGTEASADPIRGVPLPILFALVAVGAGVGLLLRRRVSS